MTVWQSLGLVSPSQLAYAAGLALLFAWRGQSFLAWVLLSDFIAILGICAAMDFGALSAEPGNDQASIAMLLVWCISAVALIRGNGAAFVVGCMSAAAIPFYAAMVYFGVNRETTYAIVNAWSFLQLAVAYCGMGGDGVSGMLRLAGYLAAAGGINRMVSPYVAQDREG